MDKKDLYNGNILLGLIISAYGWFNFFVYGKPINTLVSIASILLITIGIVGLKFLKIK
jgi:hypothetical protein